MPGFGLLELIVVFLLLLVLFGPKELPRLARGVARLIYEIRHIFQKLETEWKLSPSEQAPLPKKEIEEKEITAKQITARQIKKDSAHNDKR